MDLHGRHIDYLRISVTDRCNERCLYCMPEGYRGWQRQPDHLTAEEILRVVCVAAAMGFRKFRLTGGEPLVRQDLLEIVRAMAAIPGVDCIGLSTNGLCLDRLAGPLREAGIRTVNISLDALSPEIYRRITGGAVERVLSGFRAALAANFECIKLNSVLMRGFSESEIWPLVLFAAEHQVPLRLIELMPVTTTAALSGQSFFPVSEAMELLRQHDELMPLSDSKIGWGPAKYYRLAATGALVGFIGALTQPHFCDTCNKMRLTADGKVRPCLGDHGEVDLRAVLRSGQSDETIARLLAGSIRQKPLTHEFCNEYQPSRPMTAIGG